MLNPQVAAERLKEFTTTESIEKRKARIAALPEASRVAALALLGFNTDGTPFVDGESSNWEKRRKQMEAREKAQKQAYALLDSLSVPDLETLFATLFPRLAPVLTAWWKPVGNALYQPSYSRRPFRIAPDALTAEAWHIRQSLLSGLLSGTAAQYHEMPIDWFAAWVPYMDAGTMDTFGRLFAVVIDGATTEGDAVFDILLASGRGDHEIGAMGRHVVRGLLSAARPDGWEFVEKLLLAAQRQEGLRQSILEVIDEAHPQAFRRMLKLIRENDLFRFSATVRAADVWFGMNWVAYEKLSVKQANAATETVETFLSDPAGRDDVLATTTDGQTVYLALWSIAFDDAQAALAAAVPLLADPLVERRYAALHLLTELRLPAAQPAILAAFDDADLRVAQKAFAAVGWNAETSTVAEYVELLHAQDAAVSELLESHTPPDSPAALFMAQIKDDITAGLDALTPGTETPKTVRNDRFERLERNIPRFPAKKKELEPVIWEWDKLTADRETLADRLPNTLGDRPIERVFPYLKIMSSYGRSSVARTITAGKHNTGAARTVLFDLLGDTVEYVRSETLKAIEKLTLDEAEVSRVEGLLTRKSADLRSAAVSLLVRQRADDAVIASGERLTAAKDANQRLAGLDVLRQMVETKRSPDKARGAIAAFATARAGKLSEVEQAIVEPLTNEAHEKPTLENALGLMNPAELTRVAAPTMPEPVPLLTSLAALRIIEAINALIETHKEMPITGESYSGDKDEVLLGNADWQFPSVNLNVARDEDLKRFPLREIWEPFWDNRGEELRDADGLELIRAQYLCGESGFLHAYLHLPSLPPALEKQFRIVYDQRRDKQEAMNPYSVTARVIQWLLRANGEPSETAQADYYLRAAEASLCALTAFVPKEGGKDWREDRRYVVWFNAAGNHFARVADAWTDDQTKRLCRLIIWAQQPGELEKRQMLISAEMAAAFRFNIITIPDVYDHFLGSRHGANSRSNGFGDLQALSSRKGSPLFDTTPGLREIVDNCRRRVVEIELRRGDTETAASLPANALRYSGGQDVLLKLVAAFGKDTFVRGYSYGGNLTRSGVFSHLIRATMPGENDTPEAFAAAVKGGNIPEKRLIETAMYAPQWARHVEKTLGWEGFAEGVWWFHAHTKDNSWSVDAEIREGWTAEIAGFTPLSAADLTEGAVDVAWFGRVYETLGEARWNELDDAAKYASSAGGHKRAQLFADAMRNRLELGDLVARIETKRHQDSLRALGLLPVPDGDTREPYLLRVYKTMQEFVRTSKQFGAQRQESEKLAARIGMENLARSAGFADPIRLTWAMEAAAVADLKDGAVTHTVGDVSVSLAINGLGLPELTVAKKGKPLAAIPPAAKKDEQIAELVARKTEITRQVSRMRESLEGAMCRGDRFTGAELETLLDHPILRPLLRSLVFIEADGKEPVLGYPVGVHRLEDCNGAIYTLGPETALRIAHPFDLLHSGHWDRWQRDCFLRERIQPFKQVFRELYVLTDAERADGTKSQCYSGHQVNPKQALALFQKRGWVGGGDYDYDGDGPRKTFHEEGITASVAYGGWTGTPADVEGSTIDTVRFTKKNEWKPIPLETVPPRVFSEAMRDLDLVVSVAHVGGVDPEASQSTVEMRAALVREAMEMLKIKNVRFQKSHALIDGALATYNVHLGSAIVHRQPGGYLCIVPVASQHRGRLFLPFVDDDPRTAEVVSKVLLLARDGEIKDPTLLEQILAAR